MYLLHLDWRKYLILLVNLPTFVGIAILKPLLSSVQSSSESLSSLFTDYCEHLVWWQPLCVFPLDHKFRQFSVSLNLQLLKRPIPVVQSTHAHVWSTLDGHWLKSYSCTFWVFYHKASISYFCNRLPKSHRLFLWETPWVSHELEATLSPPLFLVAVFVCFLGLLSRTSYWLRCSCRQSMCHNESSLRLDTMNSE